MHNWVSAAQGTGKGARIGVLMALCHSINDGKPEKTGMVYQR